MLIDICNYLKQKHNKVKEVKKIFKLTKINKKIKMIKWFIYKIKKMMMIYSKIIQFNWNQFTIQI